MTILLIKLLSDVNKNLELFCEYMLTKDDENNCLIEVNSHQTKMSILGIYSTRDDILNTYNDLCDVIIKNMSEFQERGH